jgi:hypothetical protein
MTLPADKANIDVKTSAIVATSDQALILRKLIIVTSWVNVSNNELGRPRIVPINRSEITADMPNHSKLKDAKLALFVGANDALTKTHISRGLGSRIASGKKHTNGAQ